MVRKVLPEGSQVGGYTLHHLGSGGMSVVYRGEREGQRYFVKQVEASLPGEVPARQRPPQPRRATLAGPSAPA